MFMQSLYWSGRHMIRVIALTWSSNTTETWPFPTLTFFLTHSNHLQVAWVMSLCAYIHVGLMFVIILIMDEWVKWVNIGKKTIHQPKMGCSGSSGLNHGYWFRVLCIIPYINYVLTMYWFRVIMYWLLTM